MKKNIISRFAGLLAIGVCSLQAFPAAAQEQDPITQAVVTPSTNTVEVNSSLGLNLVMGDAHDGYFMVYDRLGKNAMIFNTKGEMTGKLKIELDLKEAPVFDDGAATVRLPDRSVAIIDTEGKVVKNLGQAGIFSDVVDGLVVTGPMTYFNTDDACTFYNAKGKEIKKIRSYYFQKPRPLSDGLRRFEKQQGWDKTYYGFEDASGRQVIEPKFRDAADFSEGLAAVAIVDGYQTKWGFIDTEGNYVIEPRFSVAPGSFHDGLALVTKKNGRKAFIDRTGAVVSDDFIFASDFRGGYTSVLSSMFEDNFTIVDKKFRTVAVTPYRMPGTFVRRGDYFYHAEVTAAYVFALDGTRLLELPGKLNHFHDGVAAYTCNGETGYINTAGEWIVKFVTDEF